jgi:hypothetical protein
LLQHTVLIPHMRDYINIPENTKCQVCKYCGSRPVIALTGKEDYVVKCPVDDNHYHAKGGMIDIDDWNVQNTVVIEPEPVIPNMVACYDSKLNYTFFLPAM